MMFPESKDLSAAVTVCGRGSLFFHSTELPTVISILLCRYDMLRIPVRTARADDVTRAGLPAAGGDAAALGGCDPWVIVFAGAGAGTAGGDGFAPCDTLS